MIKQFLYIGFCLIGFNMIAMDPTSPRSAHPERAQRVEGRRDTNHAIAPKEQRRMDAQKKKPIMDTREQIRIMGAGLVHRKPTGQMQSAGTRMQMLEEIRQEIHQRDSETRVCLKKVLKYSCCVYSGLVLFGAGLDVVKYLGQ